MKIKPRYERRGPNYKKKEKMNYCPICKEGWEVIKNNGKAEKIRNFPGMPPLGKPKIVCPRCAK